MSRPEKYDVLFEQVHIGPKTMRNRFYQTPQCTGFGDVFPGGQAYHRGMKAEGGWAVVNTEATTVSPEYDWAGQITPSRMWDDDDVRNWALMTDKVHEYDSLAGMQLHAGGAFITNFDSRQPARHIHNRLEEAALLGSVVAMDKSDIRVVQGQYVEAAIRARRAGFDIVNIHGAEVGALPVQFLMTMHNARTDEYGGSLENRARFWMETLEMVRSAVGDDCAIAARFCVDSLHEGPGGIKVDDEGIGFIQLADHLVDFWDLQVGGETVELWIKDAGPSRFYSENFQGPWVAKVRPYTNKPIVGVGRFTNPDTMVQVIRDGQLDIIGAARPSISDPFLPKKIEEGRIDEIRECIGCNVCVSRVNARWHLICTQNATSGEEYRRGWHPESFSHAKNADKSVLVVGGGPAGMECAIVLGKRDMAAVHLVDAAEHCGGHVDWVATLPGMQEWRRVIDWRVTQLGKLQNVSVIPRMTLDAKRVLDYGADIVVIATGSSWTPDGVNGFTHRPIRGASHDRVLTPEDVIRDRKPTGDSVLVYDTDGYYMGVSIAENLQRDGHKVTLVTPMLEPAPYMRFTGEIVHMRPLLENLGVKIVTEHLIQEITPSTVEGVFAHVPDRRVSWQADAVVLVTQRNPRDDLFHELVADQTGLAEARISGVYRAGDCHSPRQLLADAIFDAHRLAREIDSNDPMTPLPYIRERRLLGATDSDYEAVIDRAAV